MSISSTVGARDFSAKVRRQLDKKGVAIVGIQAVPDFEGDKYFSGTAYQLVAHGTSFLRTHSEVCTMAQSSWMPDQENEAWDWED
jgi:hypothetical protein